MSNDSGIDFQRIMHKIEALLQAAESDRDPVERQARIDMANKIAFKYRIDVSMAQKQKQEERKPEWREYPINYSIEFALPRTDMQCDIFKFYGAKVTNKGRKVVALGYHDDLVMAEMMWATVFLHFVSTVTPEWDKSQSFDHNVFTIKNSGRSWADIVIMAPLDYNLTMSSGSRLRRAYAAEAKRLGVDIRKQPQRPGSWRKSFAESYCSEISARLHQMQREAEQDDQADSGGEGMLALRKDSDKVAAEFYEQFPHLRPWTEEQWSAYRAKIAHEQQVEEAAYAAMTPEQRERFDRRKARDEAKMQRDSDRWYARNQPDLDGWRAGRNAAQKADLGTSSKVGSSERQALGS